MSLERILLVEIGTPAELPVVTPPAPRPPSSWVPDPRPSPGLPPPTGLAVEPVADAAVLTWTPSSAGGQTIIESAPDVAGAPGSWREVDRTGADTYTLALPDGPRWARVRAELNGRTSVATNAVLSDPRSSSGLEQGIEDLVEQQLLQDQALADETLERQLEDARIAAEAATDATNKVAAEAQQRADDLLNERLAWEAAVENEETVRESEIESLAQAMALVSAGSGEQFDSKRIWYFDDDLESWGGNGTPTIVDGWLRPANHASDPFVHSPVALGVEGQSYRFVKARIKKVGDPEWDGRLYWQTGSATWDSARSAAIPEPAFNADGTATISWDDLGWWPGTVNRIRLDLSVAQTATDYYMIDWVAIGRPTPGAGVALVQQVQQALQTADSNEALARETLAAQMRGTYTGTDVAEVTQGLVFSERQARTTAISSEAAAREALAAQVNDPSTGLPKAHSRITEEAAAAADANSVTAGRVGLLEVLKGEPSNLVIKGVFDHAVDTAPWWSLSLNTVPPIVTTGDGRKNIRVLAEHGEIHQWGDGAVDIPVSPGDVFVVSAFLRSVRLTLQFRNEAGFLANANVMHPGAAQAGPLSREIPATSGATYLRIILYNDGLLFPGELAGYARDIFVQRKTQAEKAQGQAIDSMSLAINQQDDFLQATADDLDALEVEVRHPTNGLGARARQTDFSALKTRVDTVGGGLEAMATTVQGVEAALPGKAEADAYNTLAAEVRNSESGLATKASSAAVTQATAQAQPLVSAVSWDFSTGPQGWVSRRNALAHNAGAGFVRLYHNVDDIYLFAAGFSVPAPRHNHQVRIRLRTSHGAARTIRVRGMTGGDWVAAVVEAQLEATTDWQTVVVNFPSEPADPWASGPTGIRIDDAVGASGEYADFDWVVIGATGPTASAAVTQQMRADVDGITGKVNASYTIRVSAGNYHTGVIAQSDGSQSSWRFLTDSFGVYNTSGAGLSWADGTLWNVRGAVSMIAGPSLGEGMTFYLGPTPISPQQAKRADAVFSVNADGAKVKGLLEGSLLDTGALSRNSTRIHTGNGRLAPFVIKAGGYASGGAPANRNIDVANIISPDYLSGYHFRRMAWRKSDVFLEAHVSGDAGPETLQLYVAYDGGAWQLISSITMDLGNRSAFPLLVRYTTRDTPWNVVSFNARTTQGRTLALAFKVEVDNFNESSNAANSNSGTNPGDVGGTPPSAGNGDGNDGGFRPGFPVVVP